MTDQLNDIAADTQPPRSADSILSRIPFLGRKGPIVAVIRLAGVIGQGGVGRRGLTLEALESAIQRAFSIKRCAAVVLEINSPGGSPVQSDLIAGRIREMADEKKIPVYAFCEDAAACGGGLLAFAADKIYAMPGSIVGSIGVVSSGFGFVDAIAKLGVERRVHTAGKEKAILDPFQPEKAEDIKILKRIQADLHDQFTGWVKQRRGSRLDEKKDLFTGAFWTGREAVDLGLVDALGNRRSVMREQFGDKVRFVQTVRPKSRLQRLLGMGTTIGAGVADASLDRLEDQMHWQRLGL
ncbi:MAG: S49 family peptidase [Alphaproteobacteria bacterium]|nr:S49 family peptidase [Alphaproteobacteria bacterium]